jgi:hypothetical protein
LAFGVVAVWLCVEGDSRLWLLGFGVVAEGVVELEVELDDDDEEPECELVPDELEPDEPELPLVGDELDLDVVEVVVDEDGGGEDAQVSESTTAPSGSCTDEIGAPAAIGNVTVCPVASLTVSVHALASALGSASSPASSVPASVIAKLSFRLNDNSAQLLLPAPCASSQP